MENDNPEQVGPLQPMPGHEFTFMDDTLRPIREVRMMIKDKLKRDPHIRVRIGPFSIQGSSIDAQIEAIDDPFIDGTFNFDLGKVKLGSCVYIGYLK